MYDLAGYFFFPGINLFFFFFHAIEGPDIINWMLQWSFCGITDLEISLPVRTNSVSRVTKTANSTTFSILS